MIAADNPRDLTCWSVLRFLRLLPFEWILLWIGSVNDLLMIAAENTWWPYLLICSAIPELVNKSCYGTDLSVMIAAENTRWLHLLICSVIPELDDPFERILLCQLWNWSVGWGWITTWWSQWIVDVISISRNN